MATSPQKQQQQKQPPRDENQKSDDLGVSTEIEPHPHSYHPYSCDEYVLDQNRSEFTSMNHV